VSPRALPSDTRLGHYQVVSLLGQGPFGLTYLASDPVSGAMVAIKEYLPAAYALRHPDQSVSPISGLEQDDYEFGKERFRADAQALQRVRHPSLVAVLDVFEANGTVCMVMAYEDGPSLAEALNREPTPTEWELLNIAVSLIDACRALHGAGLIHRDIKETHVRLRPDGTPVLLDFGAARVGLLRRRLAIGTGDPELDPAKLDGSAGPWTDIHALAAMLFRVAKRLGQRCSPRVVDAMRRGISVQPDDVAALTAQWADLIGGMVREMPAPEQPALLARREDAAAAPVTAEHPEGGAVPAVNADAEPEGAGAHLGGSGQVAACRAMRRDPELAARPFQVTSSEHAAASEDDRSTPSGQSAPADRDAEIAGENADFDVPSGLPRADVAPVIERLPPRESPPPCPTPPAAPREGPGRIPISAAVEAAGAAVVRPVEARPQTFATPPEVDDAPNLDRVTRWVAAAAVVAIAFGVVMWRLDARSPLPPTAEVPPSRPPAPAAGQPAPAGGVRHDAVLAAAPVPRVAEPPGDLGMPLPQAPNPAPSAVTTPPPEAAKAAEIDGLLAEAAKDLAELRLTTPRGSNAVEKYQAVLALDPDNDAAREGLSAVSDRYVDLASTALARGQMAAARRYLELAESLVPDNARARTLRRELEARKQPPPGRSAEETVAADWHGGLYDRVQDFLQSNQARPPRPPSRAEQIPDRLGGQR